MSSRRRNRRARIQAGSLSFHQREVLLQGFDLCALGPPIRLTPENIRRAQEELERQDAEDFPGGREAAWRRCRAQLLADPSLRPGTRPWAWWEYDLRIPMPTSDIAQVLELQARGLIDADEAMRIERAYGVKVGGAA